MTTRSAIRFALLALAALAFAEPSARAADTPDPVADAKAFQKFFTRSSPR